MVDSDSALDVLLEHLEMSMRSCFRGFMVLLKFITSDRDDISKRLTVLEDVITENNRLLHDFFKTSTPSCESLSSSDDSEINSDPEAQ